MNNETYGLRPDDPHAIHTRHRHGRAIQLVAVGVVALLFVGGLAILGADFYVKGRICAGMEQATARLQAQRGQASTGESTNSNTVIKGVATARTASDALVWHSELREAFQALLADVKRADRYAKATEAKGGAGFEDIAGALNLYGDLNEHYSAVQDACDQPITGIPIA